MFPAVMQCLYRAFAVLIGWICLENNVGIMFGNFPSSDLQPEIFIKSQSISKEIKKVGLKGA